MTDWLGLAFAAVAGGCCAVAIGIIIGAPDIAWTGGVFLLGGVVGAIVVVVTDR